jgi:hypothetical protein
MSCSRVKIAVIGAVALIATGAPAASRWPVTKRAVPVYDGGLLPAHDLPVRLIIIIVFSDVRVKVPREFA